MKGLSVFIKLFFWRGDYLELVHILGSALIARGIITIDEDFFHLLIFRFRRIHVSHAVSHIAHAIAYLNDIGFEAFFFFAAIIGVEGLWLRSNALSTKKDVKS